MRGCPSWLPAQKAHRPLRCWAWQTECGRCCKRGVQSLPRRVVIYIVTLVRSAAHQNSSDQHHPADDSAAALPLADARAYGLPSVSPSCTASGTLSLVLLCRRVPLSSSIANALGGC